MPELREREKRRRAEERPPAPWGAFPLAELAVLAGIVLLVIGFMGGSDRALVLGIALAAIGGLEVAVREHLAGHRSHTTLLSGAAFVLTVTLLIYVAGLPTRPALGGGAAVFAASFAALRRAFRRASGGLSFKA